MVANDADVVFSNPNEMASVYNIDGRPIKGVLTQDTFEKRNSRTSSEFADGVALHGAYFTCASHYFYRDPIRGEVWNIDGIDFTVDNVENKMGMHSITLIRNVGR